MSASHTSLGSENRTLTACGRSTPAAFPRIPSGFTLIELMVAIAVLIVITVVAVPSYRILAQNNRRAATANEFVAALSFARGQAVSLRLPVTVCRTSTAASTSPSCQTGGTGNGWEDGWVVFVDNNNNGAIDTGESLLRQHEAVTGGAASETLHGTTNVKDRVTYTAYGVTTNSGSISLCDSRGWGSDARVVVLGVAGAARAVVPAQQETATAVSSCSP